MITLTFDTWEEYDNAIAGIASVVTEMNTPEKQGYFFFIHRRVDLTNFRSWAGPSGLMPL